MRKLLLLFLVLSASDLFADWASDSDMTGIVSDDGTNWVIALPQDYTVGSWPPPPSYTDNNYSYTFSPSFISSSVVDGVLTFQKDYNFTVTISLHTQIYSDPDNIYARSTNRDEVIFVFNSATYTPPSLVYITASPQTYTNTTDEVLYLQFQDQFYQVLPGDSVTVKSSDGNPMAAAWFSQDDLFLNSTLEIPKYQTFSTGVDAGTGDVVTFEIEEGNIGELELIIGQPTDLSASNTSNTIDDSSDENWITDNVTGTISGKVINGTPTLFQPSATPSIGTGTGELGEGLNEYELAALDRINLRNEIELQAEGVGNSASTAGQDAAGNEESLIPVFDTTSFDVNGTAPGFTIYLPALMGGASVDLNPFRADRLGSVATGIRVFVTWLTFSTLAYWFANILHESLRDFNQAPQTRGNQVMGSGGQLTALACAALLTAAITIALVKVISTLTGDFAIPSVYAHSHANPFAAMSSGVIWMLDQVFPIPIMVGAAVAKVSLKSSSTAAYAVCAAVIRFIVL